MKTDIFTRELKRTRSAVSLFMLAHEVDVSMSDPWMDQISENRTLKTNREELVSLRADLALIEEGWVPPPENLAQCPLLDEWAITNIDGEPLWRLRGRAYRCSGFAAGLELVTMQVLAVDHCFTWARDRAYLYHLGRPGEVLPM